MNRSASAIFLSALMGIATPSTLYAQGYASSGSARSEHYPRSQGWSQKQMQDWYELSQGSRLIPMRWLEALKTKDGAASAEGASCGPGCGCH